MIVQDYVTPRRPPLRLPSSGVRLLLMQTAALTEEFPQNKSIKINFPFWQLELNKYI